MHEKKLHRIMVSDDLSWFDRQHPEYNGRGLDLSCTFPKGGPGVCTGRIAICITVAFVTNTPCFGNPRNRGNSRFPEHVP